MYPLPTLGARIVLAFRRLAGFLPLLLLLSTSLAADTEEKFPDGTVKLRYGIDAEGRKDGLYVENYENGKLKVKAAYTADELNGAYTGYFENGKNWLSATYKKGQLDGAYKEWTETGQVQLTANYHNGKLHGWRSEYDKGKAVSAQFLKDDEVLLPKGLDQIKKALTEIQRPTVAKGLDAEKETALRRLKAYRYLCGLPYADLSLDDEYNKLALAGAQLCEKIGRLDHKPANPGLPQEEYDRGYKGTSSGNLAAGQPTLTDAVDAWMDDSDSSNRDRIGHRRWCLNPSMRQTGFGRSGKYSVMYAFDGAREQVPDYDFVSFPPRGYTPTTFFKPSYVWSVSLHAKKYEKPGEGVKVNVYVADKDYTKTGKPLELAYSNIENSGFGIPNCIIFRPKIAEGATATRYWVEVEGVRTKDGKPAVIHWVTEFVLLR